MLDWEEDGCLQYCSSRAALWREDARIASVPVLGLDVHLQPVSAGGSVPTFLTHKELFSSMLKSLVQL